MSVNTFGRQLRLSTFGESHGRAIGGMLDGLPAGLTLDLAEVQLALDRRRPGQSRLTTQRREPDQLEVLSGVVPADTSSDVAELVVTTGTSLGFMIHNTDQRSKDYTAISRTFRPGHADLTYLMKYGVRDPRGGGRSSARETAMRVAAGAIAQQALRAIDEEARRGNRGFRIVAGVVQVGDLALPEDAPYDWSAVYDNPLYAPLPSDSPTLAEWFAKVDAARKQGDSLGAVVACRCEGAWPGLGAPIYGKLDADIASAMMSINAVKGVEIGDGFAAAALRGSENADTMHLSSQGELEFASNHAGGILGGISTGAPIVVRVAFKPTSSILTEKATIGLDEAGGEIRTIAGMPLDPYTQQRLAGQRFANTSVSTKGRHDPCVGLRAVPIVEAMLALVLLDHVLLQRGSSPCPRSF